MMHRYIRHTNATKIAVVALSGAEQKRELHELRISAVVFSMLSLLVTVDATTLHMTNSYTTHWQNAVASLFKPSRRWIIKS